MSKDLKNLINTIEKETRSQAELEQLISMLKEENKKMKSKLTEQELLIENLKNHIDDEEMKRAELPSEIDILKDIITSQRLELDERQSDIDQLNDRIDKLTMSMENTKDINQVELSNKELIEAQDQIIHLSDENRKFRDKIDLLQNQIEELKSEKSEIENFIEKLDEESESNEELINVKKLNFHLMEENGLLRVELESLKGKFQERLEKAISQKLEVAEERNAELSSKLNSLKIKLAESNEKGSADLEAANEIISILKEEIADYEGQIKYLEQQIENINEPVIVSTEDALEFAEMKEKYDTLKKEMSEVQIENQMLTEKIEQLKEKELIKTTEIIQEPQILKDIPKQLEVSLFNRMYHLFDKNDQEVIIDLLIKDLKSNNSEIKRNAIKILSHIKYKKVYNALFELANDKDWITRYYIIKALSKFEKKSEKFISLLKAFSKDADVDVRELAIKILNDNSEAKIR